MNQRLKGVVVFILAKKKELSTALNPIPFIIYIIIKFNYLNIIIGCRICTTPGAEFALPPVQFFHHPHENFSPPPVQKFHHPLYTYKTCIFYQNLLTLFYI